MTRQRVAELVLDGDDRFTTRTGTGRSMVFGDATDLDEYSPVESILASLAACSAMDVIGIANKKRQKVDRYEIHAVGEQRDEYPQVLTEITVTHEVWGADISEPAFRRCIELSATKYCPVNAMLSAGATTIHHRYAIHTTASGAGGVAPVDLEGEVVTTGPYLRPDIVGE
jgi:putative redox protein